MKLVAHHAPILVGVALTASTAEAKVGTLSGPFTHDNLQVFLIHGDTQLEERRYATLSEALEKKLVVVKETGNVQELTIENLSKDLTVFLNAGDIVKGGRQDGTVSWFTTQPRAGFSSTADTAPSSSTRLTRPAAGAASATKKTNRTIS